MSSVDAHTTHCELAEGRDAIPADGLDWRALLSPRAWLGHVSPDEFLSISGRDVLEVVSEGEIDACFAARHIGPTEGAGALIRSLLDADVQCLTHALTALLSMSGGNANRWMPPAIRGIVGDQRIRFDHIGIEVFGKLDWYLDLFGRAYAPLDINVVYEHIFPAVQVRRALGYDPELGDVRIARVYFAHGNAQVNLEVIEATQHWRSIALRQAALYAHLAGPVGRADALPRIFADLDPPPVPVAHVAFRVDSARTVVAIQEALLDRSAHGRADAMRAYTKRVFFNPSDGSTNTKIVVPTPLPDGTRLDSRIVEIVAYDDP